MRIGVWSSVVCSSDLIVGEADDVAARRSSDGNGHCARQRTTLLSLEILPCGLKARMVPGVQRRCFAERHDAPALDLGDREARVHAPKVDRVELFAHGYPLPVQMPVPMWNVVPPEVIQQGIIIH